jgi:hypothetical protein
MRPSLQRGRAWGKVRPTGFTLLAILIVVAALTLLAGTALYRGMEERRNTSLVRHDAAALAVAEVGLERTRAYLAAILAREPDLDRALDPNLDTNCASLLNLGGNVADDNLPVFNGSAPFFATAPITLSHSGRVFRKVPHDLNGDGTIDSAYLVRIDDNDDDKESLTAFQSTTNNNPGTNLNCLEGLDVFQQLGRSNLVRDRDRTVIITVIGVYPVNAAGTNVETAQTHKVLRVRVGPRQTTGVIAGGHINISGNAAVCGQFGNVSSTGNVSDGCFCGDGNGNSGCCTTATSSNCVVEAAEGCDPNLSFGTSQSVCIPGSSVPPPPKVHVWNSTNAPGKCNSVTGCTPFYYLRHSGTNTEVHMWKYAESGCDNPQACGRLFPPHLPYSSEISPCSPVCWKKVYTANVGTSPLLPPLPACAVQNAVVGVDVAALPALNPLTSTDPSWVCGVSPYPSVWQADTSQATTSPSSSCDEGDGPYPTLATAPTGALGKHSSIGTNFNYVGTPQMGPTIPRGVWLVEGNVHFTGSSPGSCTPTPPPVSVLAVGSIRVQSALRMVPAHPMGILLLAGRDLLMDQGNTDIFTCGASAAILAHEEFQVKGNGILEAQIVAEDKGECSSLVATDDAITMGGTTDIIVTHMPPIAAGPQVEILEWSESSY